VVGASKISKKKIFQAKKNLKSKKKIQFFFPKNIKKSFLNNIILSEMLNRSKKNTFFGSTSDSFLHNFSPHDSYVKLGFMTI